MRMGPLGALSEFRMVSKINTANNGNGFKEDSEAPTENYHRILLVCLEGVNDCSLGEINVDLGLYHEHSLNSS